MWNEMYESLETTEQPYPGYNLTPRPTEETLASFETQTKMKLPKSYRDYAVVFGAGEIGAFYRIATPMTIQHKYELANFNDRLHGPPEEDLLAHFGPQEEINQYFFFCADGGGIFYGWKVDETAEARNKEYGIYEFGESNKTIQVADSFKSFVVDYIMKPDSKRKWTPENSFSRFQVKESS